MIHVGWGMVAMVAFGIGYLRHSGNKPAGATGERLPMAARDGNVSDTLENATGKSRTRVMSREGLLDKLFGALSGDGGNLEGLAQQAFKDPNPITRRLAFSRLLEALTPENAEQIRAQMVALGADGQQWKDFHFSWGALAGEQAFAFAETSKEQDLGPVMAGWAAANPAAAMAMLDRLPAALEGQRGQLEESVVAGLAATDRTLATDLVMRLAKNGREGADKLMETVATEVLRTGSMAEAATWSEALPDGPLKGAAMAKVAERFFSSDPAGAAKWAAKFANKDYANRAIEQAGGPWAERDPVAAVTWLATLPPGMGKNSGLSTAFGSWEDSNPAAATEYLSAMPDSPARDSAINGFSRGYAWQNPQMAFIWASDIRDPNLRQRAMTRAGQIFFRTDPAGAKIWLENANLSPDLRTAVLTPMR